MLPPCASFEIPALRIIFPAGPELATPVFIVIEPEASFEAPVATRIEPLP